MSRQSEINRLEDAKYQAESRAQEAADLMMWSLRTLKQTQSTKAYAAIAAVMVAAGFDDFDELVEGWIEARRAYNVADRELWAVESGDEQ